LRASFVAGGNDLPTGGGPIRSAGLEAPIANPNSKFSFKQKRRETNPVVANLVVREDPVDLWQWEEELTWNSSGMAPGEWHTAKEIETPANLMTIESCSLKV
jgi:hypothetical protein